MMKGMKYSQITDSFSFTIEYEKKLSLLQRFGVKQGFSVKAYKLND